MRSQDPALIAHHNVSLMLCESEAVLEELLLEVDLTEIAHLRMGPRALLIPTPHLPTLQARLRERNVFPRTLGDLPSSPDDAP